MYLARRLTIVAMAAFAAGTVGCSRTEQYQNAKLSSAPILVDEAMVYRNADRQQALYANGFAIGQPTLFPYAPAENLGYVEQSVLAPALFGGQIVALPLSAIVTPPWNDVAYHGVMTAPTYTAVPAPIDNSRYFPTQAQRNKPAREQAKTLLPYRN